MDFWARRYQLSYITVVASSFLSPLLILLYTLRVEKECVSYSLSVRISDRSHLETQSSAIRHQLWWKPKERCLKESVGLTQSRSVANLSAFLNCRRSLSTVMTDLRSASIGAHAATEWQLDGPILLAAPVRSPLARPSDWQEGLQLFAHWQPG